MVVLKIKEENQHCESCVLTKSKSLSRGERSSGGQWMRIGLLEMASWLMR